MSQWIKISEKLPELDTRVLLLFGNQMDNHIEAGYLGDDGAGLYHYFFDGDSLFVQPTHWQPLPELP